MDLCVNVLEQIQGGPSSKLAFQFRDLVKLSLWEQAFLTKMLKTRKSICWGHVFGQLRSIIISDIKDNFKKFSWKKTSSLPLSYLKKCVKHFKPCFFLHIRLNTFKQLRWGDSIPVHLLSSRQISIRANFYFSPSSLKQECKKAKTSTQVQLSMEKTRRRRAKCLQPFLYTHFKRASIWSSQNERNELA